jgi:NADH dehydrogenase [ubiquinone] 1 alpha subcomplex assembly factor 6
MRMQFWRDNITRTFARTPPKEPVAILLHKALESLKERHPNAPTSSLKNWCMKIINAREQYMDNRPYPSMDALESYAEATYSTLMYLTLGFLPLHSISVDHLASHIGKAAGIAAVLRGMPLIAFPPPPNHHSNSRSLGGDSGSRHGAVILPLDVMAKHNCKQEDVLRQGANAPGLKDVVFDVATRANDHLITARNMLGNLQQGKHMGHDFEHEGEEGHQYATKKPDTIAALLLNEPDNTAVDELAQGFGVLMPAVSTRLWLERLEKSDFDVFKPEVRGRSLKLPWSSYWAYKQKQI